MIISYSDKICTLIGVIMTEKKTITKIHMIHTHHKVAQTYCSPDIRNRLQYLNDKSTTQCDILNEFLASLDLPGYDNSLMHQSRFAQESCCL